MHYHCVLGAMQLKFCALKHFAQDALAECYFGWNAAFGGRGEHNLLRARGQASLAASVRARATEARRLVARAR